MLITNFTGYLAKQRGCWHVVVTQKMFAQLSAAFFFFGGDAEAPPPPPPPPFPNGSGLLPAILLFNPLIRRSTEKRFAGGHWPCPVAASYVSDCTRPVDTRGISAAEERRGLRPARFEAGGFKSAQKKVPPTPKHVTTSFVVHLFISKR